MRFFPPTATSVAQGSLAQFYFRCDPVQLQHQVAGKVPVQRLGEVPEGSGADAEVRFRIFPSREGSSAGTQVRFRKVPVQRLGEVPEGSGTEVR